MDFDYSYCDFSDMDFKKVDKKAGFYINFVGFSFFDLLNFQSIVSGKVMV